MWGTYFSKEKSLDEKSDHNHDHSAPTEMGSYFIVADCMGHQQSLLVLLAQGVHVNSAMKTSVKWNLSPHDMVALS